MTRMFRLLTVSLLLALIAPAVHGVPVAAAVDELDPAFGSGGKVILESTLVAGSARALALQVDGKIVVAGDGPGLTVARFTSAGVPDTSFDGDGVASVGPGSAAALAIQADGKIVVAGTTAPDGFCCQLALARFNTNGSPDTTFDGDGSVVTNPGVVIWSASLAIQSDGKIVVSGGQSAPPVDGMYVGRYNTNGSVDGTFGSGGFVLTTVPGGANGGSVALQADGKIVVAGSGGNTSDFLIARYTPAGAPDTTFDTDGLSSANFGDNDNATDVVIQADGKIVAVGWTGPTFAVARFNATGTLDSGFDGDGKVTTGFVGGSATASGVAIQSNGKIVVVGSSYHDYDSSFAIARYDTDGWLDGRTTTDFGDPDDVGVLCPPGRLDCSEDRATGVAIQGDAKIVVVGGGGPCGGPCQWTMARYLDIAPIKDLGVAPGSVNFGTATVGGAAKLASVTVTNKGSTGVAITSLELAGSGTGLSISGETCPVTLAARATCTIELRYAPIEKGILTGELRIHSDAPTSPAVVALTGSAVLPPSGVAWGTTYRAGPAYTWNGGGALARTVQSGTQRLHLAYSTDRVSGAWAKDSGPYVGVYYVRSTSGSTWTTPRRLNPSGQHAAQLGLAAAGARVYATWVSQTKWVNYSPTAPRVLYVRVNTNYGDAASWRSTVRLTTTSGRVDYPTIAAAGTDVHIAYTDSVTGAVRVATSRDRGVTWAKTSIGSSTLATTSGRLGMPSVAVTGSTVVVAWISDAGGTVKARISTNRGVTWGTTVTVGSQSTGAVSTAVLGTRVAVAWATPSAVVIRQRVSGVWQAAKVIVALAPGSESLYSPQVVLQGSSAIGIAWAEQKPGDFVADLRWAESANGGSLWFAEQTLGSSLAAGRQSNDWPSVLWPSAGTRYVAWNGWSPFSTNYRLYLRTGTGIPVSPAVAATDWQPSADAVLPWQADDGTAPMARSNKLRARD